MDRNLVFLIIIAAFVGGCSHEAKKDETMAQAKSDMQTKVAKTVEKTKPTEKAAADKVECSVSNDTRVVEVRDKGKGCELVYTKAGKEAVLASAANSKDYCLIAMSKLEDKLKASGFSCK